MPHCIPSIAQHSPTVVNTNPDDSGLQYNMASIPYQAAKSGLMILRYSCFYFSVIVLLLHSGLPSIKFDVSRLELGVSDQAERRREQCRHLKLPDCQN
jgi:hypothetical protein